MRRVAVGLIFLLWCILAACSAASAEETRFSGLAKDDQPINIASDRLEADDLARQVKFLGHVTVRRGDATLYAQEVTVFYLEGRGDIDRIAAAGEVRIIQGDRIATADRAMLYQKEGKIVLNGDAQLRQGQDSIKGEEVTVFLNEERSIIKSPDGGRVNAIFHPKSKETPP